MPSYLSTTGHDADSPGDASQLHNASWARSLAALRAALDHHAAAIAEQFSGRLLQLPSFKQNLEALARPEFEQILSQQGQDLLALAAADLTEQKHRAIALQVGRIHAIVGISRQDLVHSRYMLHSVVRGHVGMAEHGDAVSLLARRLVRGLAWQMEAYDQLEDSRQKVVRDITRLVWSVDSYTDLIGQAAAILDRHDEVAGCSFGRPDAEARFRFEAASGENMADYLSELERSATSPIMAGGGTQDQGPTGRAWHSRVVERCVNFTSDPRMAPWLKAATRAGFRSSVAVPLCQPDCAPTAILTLYSEYSGGYSASEQATFITQLQTLLTFALTRIESQQGRTHTIPYGVRQRWAGLLRSDALEMYYQPLLDLETGKVTSVEALARLRDGDQVLTPASFFSALSSDDFAELYARGLRQALSQRNRWQEQGLDLSISVNLPTNALLDARYFSATEQALRDYGCPAQELTLEVLETDELPAGVDVAGALEKFKALDVRFAQDDLGSGHSSLTRLRTLPFDAFKIDRGIVARADEDQSNVLRFIYQLTRLGHSLGKSVTVEGVETEDLLEAVRVLGVDAVQGYVIARPMPASKMTEWMKMDCQSGRADWRPPVSALAKLAQLLVWEEHLQLHLAGAMAGSSLTAKSGEEQNTHDEGNCLAVDSTPQNDTPPNLSAEFTADFRLAVADPGIQSTLIDAAVKYGPRSTEYQAARQRLVARLTCTKA